MTGSVSPQQHAAVKGRKRKGRPRAEPAKVTRVVPEAWRVALDLADGDVARLKVIDEQTVLVMNQPRRPR